MPYCHEPHLQLQKNYKGTDAGNLYLAQGTIESCVYNGVDGTSTLTYSSITYKTGWDATKLTKKTGDYRRTVLFPNVNNLNYDYPITAVDSGAQTITVKGNACTNLSLPTTFAAMYGQFVKDSIDIEADPSVSPPPASIDKAVKFFDQTGTNSFADGDATYNGICEVCHTQTKYHRNNASGEHTHYAGTNCTTCHSHTNGFAHGGGGGGTNCVDCHGTTGSHSAHVSTIACDACHDNPPHVRPGAGYSFTYDNDTNTCFNINSNPLGSCHFNTDATWDESACTGCHGTTEAMGNRVNVMAQLSGNSHHIQGTTVEGAHCYQCHWEADENGLITSYHENITSGSAVDLVIYGSDSRPAGTTYTSGVTGIAYTANGNRAEIKKLNTHCLSCHSNQNDATVPFGDGKTPKQYAWDGKSIDARYSLTGTTPWGKYDPDEYPYKPNVTPKHKRTKAYSAHGNAEQNEGGWDLNEGWPNTRDGRENLLCYDCHNSHGSSVNDLTTSYVTATTNGGILKDVVAGRGGYGVTYKPEAGGSAGTNNAYKAGAGLCFDCHLNETAGTTPWGYKSTFGAEEQIAGYWDTPYFGPGESPSKKRYAYKITPRQGGHFGRSSDMDPVYPPREQIGGLCTPCHDPHGVSPALGANMEYSIPLLKGTWLTSPYKEDTAPIDERVGNVRKDKGREGIFYNIDQNTFSWNTYDTVEGITETDSEFGGLCLRCHPKSDLLSGSSAWKSKRKLHQSVKGWGGYGKHKYSCSKCHTVHNARLPRLMVTNCLDKKHKGFMGNNPSPIVEGQGSGVWGTDQKSDCAGGQSTELGYCPDGVYRPYRFINGSDIRPREGQGGGHIPGSWHGGPRTDYYQWGESVRCHENQTGDDTDQSWNARTEWLDDYTPEMLSGPYVSSMFAVGSDVRATVVWITRSDSSSNIDYGFTTSYGATTGDATLVTNHSITLTGLTNHSTYHYRVRSTDGGGSETVSSDHTFYISVGPTVPITQSTVPPACTVPCEVTLDWDASTDPDSGPVEYYAEVTDPSTGNIYTSGWTTDTDWTVTLAPSYWCWKVRARDGNHPEAVSDWSEELCFNTMSSSYNPTAPTLIPEPDIVSIDPENVKLEWNASTSPLGHALEYVVQVDDASDFSSINHTSGWISATTWNITLAQEKTWHWRVRARDVVIPQLLSDWSLPDQFTISTAGAPPAPTLTPEPNVNGTGPVTVTLEWSTVTCPDLDPVQYYVEIDNDSDFSSPMTSGWLSNTTWDVTLATATTWRWRVKARDSVHTDAVSPWSTADDFAVTGITEHGGNRSCVACHGHDDGWKGNNYYGTTFSHSTHTENDTDDFKGPLVSCNSCHTVSVGGAYYKDITIQSSKVEEDLTDFPVLFTTTDADLKTTGNGGHVYSDNGYDIVFADGSGNKLSHEIITYEKTTGEYAAWIKIPNVLSGTNTTIRMYYGDADITESTEDTDGVWDSYAGVWHLEEDPSGTAPQVKDSTDYGNNGTSGGGMTSDDLVDGKIRKALIFDGDDEFIDIKDSYSLEPQRLTVSAWVNMNGPGSNIDSNFIVAKGRANIEPYFSYGFAHNNNTNQFLFQVAFNDNTKTIIYSSAAYDENVSSWYHLAGTYDGSVATFYIDGQVVGSAGKVGTIKYDGWGGTAPSYGIPAQDVTIGMWGYSNTYRRAFKGTIEEVRISNTAHSAGRIKTSYNNQDSPATFYNIGLEQTGSGPLLTHDPIDLGTTTACNNCHSAGGVFNGAAMAKANWAASIYSGTMLQTGKEQWCTTCHDNGAASSRKDGTGILAPNVVGDNVTYGYHVTGHNVNCLSCHDTGKHHIDHVHRSYKFNESTAVADTPYVDSYRLKAVDGQPGLVIPKPNRDPITNWKDFALCFSCHNRNDILGSDAYDVSGTNFWDNDGSLVNSHYVHMSDTSGDKRFDSDWDGNRTNESRPSCIACHNVHGSPSKVMMRHGELISTYGTTDKVPGLDFAYLVGAMPGTPDPTATLDESIGGRMGSFTAVCSTCHNPNRSYYRSPRLAPSVVNPLAYPNPLDLAGGTQEVLFTCGVIDPSGSLYLDVVINLTTLLGDYDQRMYDDGTNGDLVAGDDIFSYRYIVPLTAGSGIHRPLITARNAYGTAPGRQS